LQSIVQEFVRINQNKNQEARSQKQKFVVFVKLSLIRTHLWINFVVPIAELKIKNQKGQEDGIPNQLQKGLEKIIQHLEMGCMQEAQTDPQRV